MTSLALPLSTSLSPLLFLILLSLLPLRSNSQSQTPQQQLEILLKIKSDWQNPPSLSNWTSSNGNFCTWPEINCTAGTITEINLQYKNLSSPIPSSICQLTNLTRIDVYWNNIPGPFPIYLSNCSNLHYLDISQNYFVGRLPSDIGGLSSLRHFYVLGNNFTGNIPPEIGRMSNLIELTLSMNLFNGSIPSEMGDLGNLEALALSDLSIMPQWRLPPEFGRLKKLKRLWIRNSNLNGEIPESLTNLTDLKQLDLSGNTLSGDILRDLFRLKNLTWIKISNNQFTGPLPDQLAWDLSRLEISKNKFSGPIPARISYSKILIVFKASNNQFSGEIPASLTGLTQLHTLELDGNRISGEVPPKIISWRSLTVLNLSRNQLTGEIPAAIGLLPALNSLDLSGNQLSGEIPPELCRLKHSQLNLSSNRLSGEIPDGLAHPGLEQSFINNPSLCSSNPFFHLHPCASQSHESFKISPRVLAIAGLIALLVPLLAWFAIRDYRQRKQRRNLATWKLTSFQRLDFTEANIVPGLIESNLIGSGGSGKVYRISVGNRAGDTVAVKKIWNSNSLDAKLEKEFHAEVEILGQIRHANIVKLLCCISSEDSKLLVYEYMENGSLDCWLFKKRNSAATNESGRLDWPSRYRIAVDVAEGLCYMHHSCSPPIIHRDVKSSNILLDSEFNARIADFGLACMLEMQGEPKSMSEIAGSYGYIAPEYAYTTRVNRKCDVYSFGVVLLELATGREAYSTSNGYSGLAEWAQHYLQEGKDLVEALDEEVREPAYLNEMVVVFRLGLMCTGMRPSTRPSMKDVLQILLKRVPPQKFGSKKASSEDDVAPLLQASGPIFGNIGVGKKIPSLEDEHGSLV